MNKSRIVGIVLALMLAIFAVGCAAESTQTQTVDKDGKPVAQEVHSKPDEIGNAEGIFWVTPDEGTVVVQTIYGEIKQIIRPAGGGKTIFGTLGDEYYPVNVRAFSDSYNVAATAQNAPLHLNIQITAKVLDDDASVSAYVRKFGLSAVERHQRRSAQITGVVNDAVKAAVNPYEAYALLSNQEEIKKKLMDTLKPYFKEHFYLDLEAVQIMGRPDFDDDRIDNAASGVVAAQKEKEKVEQEQAANKLRAEGQLESARIDAEKKKVESTTYSNPQYVEIRKLELQREIAAEWAKHQGPLVFGTPPSGTRFNIGQ